MGNLSAVLSAKSSRTSHQIELLTRDFYARDTLLVARELLGKIVVTVSRPVNSIESLDGPNGGITAGRIVETEGYHGSDPASHSARGMTKRCAPMFSDPGIAYVYFIYGMYEMLNFVTEPKGYAGAVLIRALEPVAGHALMARRRKGVSPKDWTNGPGRLTRALGIKMSHNIEPLTGPRIFVVDDGCRPEKIYSSKRVGIKEGSELRWRYFIHGNSYVSRVHQNKTARKFNVEN